MKPSYHQEIFTVILLIIGLFCQHIVFGNSSELVLVNDGKPNATIVLQEKPTRAAQMGAFELQHHIKLITGVELPVVRAVMPEKGIKIFVGGNNEGLTGEISIIRFNGDKIILAGNDSPDYGVVSYDKPNTYPKLEYNYRGSLYAVYDFLEIHCGIRFYGPDESGTTYRERQTLTVYPAAERKHTPPMDALRFLHFDDSKGKDFSLLRLRWRHTRLFGHCNHNMYSIFFRYWDRAQKKYSVPTKHADVFIEKRPWYFAQGYQGKNYPKDPLIRDNYPNDPDVPPQICLSQPDVVKYFAEEAVAYFKGGNVVGGWGNLVGAKPTNMTMLPRMEGKPFFYPIQGGDTGGSCKCEKCLSKYLNLPEDQRYSNLFFQFISEVAKEAEKKQPGTGISTLAYIATLPYPKAVKLPDNVCVTICLPISSWWHPVLRKYQEKIYQDWITNEAKKRPLIAWIYLFGPAWDGMARFNYKPFPGLYPWKTGEIISGFLRDGVRGMTGEVTFKHNFLEAYVSSRLCYDSSVSPEDIIDEFFENYYGAAGTVIKEFYRMLENLYWNPANYPKGWFASEKVIGPAGLANPCWSASGFHTPEINWSIGTPERLFKINSLLEKAGTLVKTPAEKRRLQRIMDDIWKPALQGRKDFEQNSNLRNSPKLTVKVPLIVAAKGDLTKINWKAAQVLKDWKSLNDEKLIDSPELRLICDEEFLYLKYSETGDIGVEKGLWTNNVELFFSSAADFPVFQFAISPCGETAHYRYQIINDVKSANKNDFGAILNNPVVSRDWGWELAIPFAKLPPVLSSTGGALAANFFRTKKGAGEAAWSPIYCKAYIEGLQRSGRLYLPFPVSHNVNNPLKSKNNLVPDMWKVNPIYKPQGKVEILSRGEYNAVQISSGQALTALYCQTLLPVTGDDTVILEFDAYGNKKMAIAGLYLYTGFSGDFVQVMQSSFALSKQNQHYKFTFKIPAQLKGKRIDTYRIMLSSPDETTLVFSKPETTVSRSEK